MKPGDAIFIRYEGPRGSGMPEEMETILAERRANWQPKPQKYTKGLLKLYAQHAVSPMKGAYME